MLQNISNPLIKEHQIKFIKNLKRLLPFILSFSQDKNTLNIVVKPEDLIFTLTVLNKHTDLQYKLLTSITGVDYPDRSKRFEVIYELLSVRYNSRIRVKALVNEVTPLTSCYRIFPAAT